MLKDFCFKTIKKSLLKTLQLTIKTAGGNIRAASLETASMG